MMQQEACMLSAVRPGFKSSVWVPLGHEEGISPMIKALLCRSSSAILPQSASPRPGSCSSLCRARRLAQ